VEAAIFNTRGIDAQGRAYNHYTEDAVIAGEHDDVIFAGAFDQAGGAGKVPGHDGWASERAAAEVTAAIGRIRSGVEPEVALRDAVRAAHLALRERAKAGIEDQNGVRTSEAGLLTTLVAGVVRSQIATVVNAGDSQAILIRGGRIIKTTRTHNFMDESVRESGDINAGIEHANILTSGVGAGEVKIDVYHWPVKMGDRLVFFSDGVCDANLHHQQRAYAAGEAITEFHGDATARELEAIAGRTRSARSLVTSISRYVEDQVRAGRGKPDNASIAAVLVK
jgi:serine/threonine protein phosphatase PrpC